MNDTVVDSSVVAKWIIAEVDSAQAQRVVSEAALQSKRLIVLDLAFVEVTNAIWKLHHRGLATLDETRQSGVQRARYVVGQASLPSAYLSASFRRRSQRPIDHSPSIRSGLTILPTHGLVSPC